jgi:peptidoglycan/xylan/chitin deacetylase (PgdA/CDA1 family)
MEEGRDIASEILLTDELIRKHSTAHNIYFRAPWGLWNASVAAHLNEQVKNGQDHIGPFNWDIDSDDWRYWRDKGSPEDCASACLDKIRQINRGIILMHDSTADISHIRENNQTFETVQLLIPRLKELGYHFVGLNQIPLHAIEQAPPVPF